jgi:hypothetical protein
VIENLKRELNISNIKITDLADDLNEEKERSKEYEKEIIKKDIKLKEFEKTKNIIYTEEEDHSIGPIIKLKNLQNENNILNICCKSDSEEITPGQTNSQNNLEDKKILIEAFANNQTPSKNEANIIYSPQSNQHFIRFPFENVEKVNPNLIKLLTG